MRRGSSLAAASIAAAMLIALAAAKSPAALAPTRPGIWELSGVPGSVQPLRRCVTDTSALAQFEHRGRNCTRVVINDSGASAEIHYTCAGGGFGRTKMTVLTPRSMRIETQGISDNLPFNYVLQARRVGDCGSH